MNGSSKKLSQLKNSSLKSVRSEASLLPDPNIGLRKYSPLEDNSSLLSMAMMNHREISDVTPLLLCNDVMPRKFSHINKLAQGLVLNGYDDIPVNLATKFDSDQPPEVG